MCSFSGKNTQLVFNPLWCTTILAFLIQVWFWGIPPLASQALKFLHQKLPGLTTLTLKLLKGHDGIQLNLGSCRFWTSYADHWLAFFLFFLLKGRGLERSYCCKKCKKVRKVLYLEKSEWNDNVKYKHLQFIINV